MELESKNEFESDETTPEKIRSPFRENHQGEPDDPNRQLDLRPEFALNDSLSKAVASYKAVVARANPEVIEELITGDTISSIDDSLYRAKELVSKVRRGVESEISLAKVPAGAPERTSPDLSALSPREKIQYAMGKK